MATIPTVRTLDAPAAATAGDAAPGDTGEEFPALLALSVSEPAAMCAAPAGQARGELDEEPAPVAEAACVAGSVLATVAAALGAGGPAPPGAAVPGASGPGDAAPGATPPPDAAARPGAAMRRAALLIKDRSPQWSTPVEPRLATTTGTGNAIADAAEAGARVAGGTAALSPQAQAERNDTPRPALAPGAAAGAVRSDPGAVLALGDGSGPGGRDSSTDDGSRPRDSALAAFSPGGATGVRDVAADGGAGRTLHGHVGTPQWREALGAEVRVLVERGGGSATLRLVPEDLGPVEVRIEVGEDRAHVYFTAAHAETRAALTDALPRLREMLASVGVELADAGVQREAPRDPGGGPARAASAAPHEPAAEERLLEVHLAAGRGLVDEYA